MNIKYRNKLLTFATAENVNDFLNQEIGTFTQEEGNPVKKIYKANDNQWYVWVEEMEI